MLDNGKALFRRYQNVAVEAHRSRCAQLCARQNRDGGWGYFPGKQSWLEPTAYALLALLHGPEFQPAWERGWALLRSWQREDGAWRPSAQVDDAHWTTSLCVTLHCLHGVYDRQFDRGLDWLLKVRGAEGGLLSRIGQWLHPETNETDFSLTGWPWRPSTSSWVEPTAHALVALRKALPKRDSAKLRERLSMGERMLVDRRCKDGGWNYGNTRVLRVDLPSYPETTALGLIGLLDARGIDLAPSLRCAQRYYDESRSPLARVWLRIALRSYHTSLVTEEDTPEPADNLLLALQIIGESHMAQDLFRGGVA